MAQPCKGIPGPFVFSVSFHLIIGLRPAAASRQKSPYCRHSCFPFVAAVWHRYGALPLSFWNVGELGFGVALLLHHRVFSWSHRTRGGYSPPPDRAVPGCASSLSSSPRLSSCIQSSGLLDTVLESVIAPIPSGVLQARLDLSVVVALDDLPPCEAHHQNICRPYHRDPLASFEDTAVCRWCPLPPYLGLHEWR